MGFLSSLLSGLKGGLDQGIMKTLPNPGIDSGILRAVQSVAPQMAMGQAAAPSTMLGALLQRDANGHRSILGNLGGILKNPEALNYIGAALKDMSGDDGNLMAAEQNVLARQEKAKKDALALQSRQAISEAMKGAYGDDGKFDPMLFAQNMLGSGSLSDAGDVLNFAKAAKPEPVNPQILNTRRGIFQYTPGQGLSPLQEFEDEQNAPVGYRWRGEQLEYIPGGPADPHVAGGLAGARRAPPRPRQSAAPSGPWQRYRRNR